MMSREHVPDYDGVFRSTDMTESTPRDDYAEFVRRIRQGDERAAEELVRRYESEIRLEVRVWLRLRNPALRRVFDSMDICQSVMASFFARAAVGDFDLEEPPQLIRLLVGMARNKVAEQARHHQRQRRDVRRVGDLDLQEGAIATGHATPSRLVSGRELLQKFRERLSDDERQIADLRGRGYDWASVAKELGGTAESRRKQLARAVLRAEQDLGLDPLVD
jgi:RNA polymerase sigma factor (sigma-70 family)